MAARVLGDRSRQQRLIRPVSFLAGLAAFLLSMGALSPLGAAILALIAGILAGWINEKIHHATLMTRIMGGGAASVLLILGLNAFLGVPFLVGGVGCLVLYTLL